MTLVPAARVLARIAWMRLVRGRTLYVTAVIATIPFLLMLPSTGARGKFEACVETVLRILVPLAACIHLSGAVGDELDQKTFTFLWSRPIPRHTILFGRLLVMTPLLFALSLVVIGVGYVVASGAGASPSLSPTTQSLGAEQLQDGVVAALASCFAYSAFAIGGGALFPRQPLLFTIGVSLTIEQFLFAIPAVKYISILTHTRTLAGVAREPGTPNATQAVAALIVLVIAWCAIGIARVTTAEYAAGKE